MTVTGFSASAANSALTFSWDVCANLINKDNIKSIILHLNDFEHATGSGAISSYTLPSAVVTDLNTGNVTDIVKTFTVNTYNGAPLENGTLYGAAIYIQLKNGTSHFYSLPDPIKPLSVPEMPIFDAIASESAISIKLINYTDSTTGLSLNGLGATGFEELTKVFIYLSNNTAKTFQILEIDDVTTAFGANLDQYYKIEGLFNANDYEVSVSTENSLGMSPMSATVVKTPSDLPGEIADRIALPTIVYDGTNVLTATVLFGNADDQESLLETGKELKSYSVYRYNVITVNNVDQRIESTKTRITTFDLDASGLSSTKDGSGVIITYDYDYDAYPFKVTDTTVVDGTRYIYGIAGTNINGEGVYTYTNVMRAGKLADAPNITLTPTDEDVLATAVRPTNMGGFSPIVSVDSSGVLHYLFSYTWSYLDASGDKVLVAEVDSDASSVSSGETLVNGRTYTVEAQLITEYETVRYYGLPVSKTSVPYGPAPAPENFTLSAVDEEGPLDGKLVASWDEVTDKNGSTGAITYSILVEASGGVMEVFKSGIVGTTDTLTGLTNGQTYKVTVRADVFNDEINASVHGTQTGQEEATPFRLPGAASNLRFSRPTDASLVFTFDACSNITGLGSGAERYKITVYELTPAGVYSGPSAEYILSATGTKSQSHSGINGKSYEFVLVTGVYDQTQTTTYYNESPQTLRGTMYGIPDAPRNFAVQPMDGKFRVTWDAPLNLKGTTLSGYRIRRGIAPGYTTVATLGTEVEYFVAEGYPNDSAVNVSIFTIASAAHESSEILSTAAGPIAVMPKSAPNAPLNLSSSGSDSQVTLTWTRDNDVAGYQITQDDNPTYLRTYALGDGSGWTFGVNTITFVVGSLTNGTEYTFKVSAFKISGGSNIYSPDTSVFAVPFAAPTSPQSLSCTVASQLITSSWSAPSSTAGANLGDNGPILYRLVIDASYTDMSGANQISVTNNVLDQDGITAAQIPYTFSSTSLRNGKLYLVKVSAYFINRVNNQRYSSDFTEPQLVIPNPPPQDVSGLTIVQGNMQNILSWINPTDTSANLYPRVRTEIYFRIGSGSETKITPDLSANITTYTHSSLVNGSQYNYRVVSIHSSSAQQPAGATISGIPFGKPILMSVAQNTAGRSSYTLTLNRNGRDLLDYVFVGALPDGSGNLAIPVLNQPFGTLSYSGNSGSISGTNYAANQLVDFTVNMGVNVNSVLAIIENAAGFTVKTIPTGTTTVFGNL